MTDFGFDHLTLVREPACDFVSKAAEAGAASVSLFLKPRRFEGAELLPALMEDEALVAETRRRVDDSGVRVAVVEGLLVDPAFSEDYVRHGLEVANRLGAGLCNTLIFDEDSARADDNLGRLCELARAAGVRVLLEFTPLSQVATIGEAAERVERHGCGIMLDTLHLERSGGSPEDLRALCRRLPGAVGYVQVSDGPAGPVGDIKSYYREGIRDRMLPGEGAIPIREMLDIVGPGITVSAEIPNSQVASGALSPQAHLEAVARSMKALLAAR